MAKTKIKADAAGLYVLAGSWITRPDTETQFKEGDSVKANHHAGSTDASVSNDNIKEIWSTQSLMSFEYITLKKFLDSDTFDKLMQEFKRFYNANPKDVLRILHRPPYSREELSIKVEIGAIARELYFAKNRPEQERKEIVEYATRRLITTVDKYLNHTKNI